MAEQTHRPGPTLNLNTRVMNNSITQLQTPSPSQASTQHSGHLYPGISPVASTNPPPVDPGLHQRVVEILASTANGYIHEVGYPQLCTRLMEVERAFEALKGVEVQTRIENTKLTRIIDDQRKALHTSKQELTQATNLKEGLKEEINSLRQELDNLRRENIMLRTNAPEAFKLLEKKYFYALDLLKHQHAPIVTEALRSAQVRQGSDRQVISPVNHSPHPEYTVVSTQTHLPPNTMPTMGPPQHLARKFTQQPLHPAQRAAAGPSYSQPTIPAKRPLSDANYTSSASTSIDLPPSFSRKPVLHTARPLSFSAPPVLDVSAPGNVIANRGPNPISFAAIPFSSNGVSMQSSVKEDRVRFHELSPTEAFPYHFNPLGNRAEPPPRSRSAGAIVNSDVMPKQADQRAPVPAHSLSNSPTPIIATPIEQPRPEANGRSASANVAASGQSSTSTYPISMEDVKKLDITIFAGPFKDALASSPNIVANTRGYGTPVESRVEKVQEIPERRVGGDPGEPQGQTLVQARPTSPPREEKVNVLERGINPVQSTPGKLPSDDTQMKEPLPSTDAIGVRRLPAVTVKHTEIPAPTPISTTIRPIEVDHQATVPLTEPMKTQSSETHSRDAMDVSDDNTVPAEEPPIAKVPAEEISTEETSVEGQQPAVEEDEDEDEEPEEDWGDLTDDETNNASGTEKRPVVDCISSIFYDDDQDERFCHLCNLRIKNHGLTEVAPTFSESSMRDLISHAKEYHPIPWEKLRHQSNDAAV